MEELESLVSLGLIEGLGSVLTGRLIASFGSAAAALVAPLEELLRVEGIGPETAAGVRRGAAAADIAAELRAADRAGARLIPRGNPEYPELLAEIYDPPPLLYVRGSFAPADRHAIAVVGARRCSLYGEASAGMLSGQLAGLGFTVVSGMARGIDTAAHRGALKAGGRTIAVLGSGLARLYPAENAALADGIAASGAVVSEFPMRAGPLRGNFPLRNRVISGLSLGVLVVEAARKSGSLITVAQALGQGRSVFAVPGRIDSIVSRGTHALIRDGARLVESADDICEEFPYLFDGHGSGGREAQEPPRPRLTGEEEAVLEHVGAEERSIDDIIGLCGLSARAVAASLFSLELKRVVNQLPGKMFRKSR